MKEPETIVGLIATTKYEFPGIEVELSYMNDKGQQRFVGAREWILKHIEFMKAGAIEINKHFWLKPRDIIGIAKLIRPAIPCIPIHPPLTHIAQLPGKAVTLLTDDDMKALAEKEGVEYIERVMSSEAAKALRREEEQRARQYDAEKEAEKSKELEQLNRKIKEMQEEVKRFGGIY